MNYERLQLEKEKEDESEENNLERKDINKDKKDLNEIEMNSFPPRQNKKISDILDNPIKLNNSQRNLNVINNENSSYDFPKHFKVESLEFDNNNNGSEIIKQYDNNDNFNNNNNNSIFNSNNKIIIIITITISMATLIYSLKKFVKM
jgi:hypothetical protein